MSKLLGHYFSAAVMSGFKEKSQTPLHPPSSITVRSRLSTDTLHAWELWQRGEWRMRWGAWAVQHIYSACIHTRKHTLKHTPKHKRKHTHSGEVGKLSFTFSLLFSLEFYRYAYITYQHVCIHVYMYSYVSCSLRHLTNIYEFSSPSSFSFCIGSHFLAGFIETVLLAGPHLTPYSIETTLLACEDEFLYAGWDCTCIYENRRTKRSIDAYIFVCVLVRMYISYNSAGNQWTDTYIAHICTFSVAYASTYVYICRWSTYERGERSAVWTDLGGRRVFYRRYRFSQVRCIVI